MTNHRLRKKILILLLFLLGYVGAYTVLRASSILVYEGKGAWVMFAAKPGERNTCRRVGPGIVEANSRYYSSAVYIVRELLSPLCVAEQLVRKQFGLYEMSGIPELDT